MTIRVRRFLSALAIAMCVLAGFACAAPRSASAVTVDFTLDPNIQSPINCPAIAFVRNAGAPMPGATVELYEGVTLLDTKVTNTAGRASFSIPGQTTVHVEVPGFTVSPNVRCAAGNATD